MADGVKIIHLVRDPRGVMSSRLKMDPRLWRDLSVEAKPYCDEGLKDMEYLETFGNIAHKNYYKHHILDNYHLVRYEDLARMPVEMMEVFWV